MDNLSSEGNSQPNDNAPANRNSLDNVVKENKDNEVCVLFYICLTALQINSKFLELLFGKLYIKTLKCQKNLITKR